MHKDDIIFMACVQIGALFIVNYFGWLGFASATLVCMGCAIISMLMLDFSD